MRDSHASIGDPCQWLDHCNIDMAQFEHRFTAADASEKGNFSYSV